MQSALKPEVFRKLYRDFAAQNPKWNEIPSSTGDVYEWDAKSTYIQEPPFFTNFSMKPGTIAEITRARPLGIFGDSVTTDHISPAGASHALVERGREGARDGGDRGAPHTPHCFVCSPEAAFGSTRRVTSMKTTSSSMASAVSSRSPLRKGGSRKTIGCGESP